MTRWAAFAGITAAVLFLLLALARASQGLVSMPSRRDVEWLDALPDGASHLDATSSTASRPGRPSMSTGELLANVGFSHGLFLLVLAGGAVYADVPADALGVSLSTRELLVGVGFGLALAVANTAAGAAAHALGHTPSEDLRRMLAPDGAVGWALLLAVVLPLVALFEEFLFRAALIGGLSAGFGVSPWLLAVGSSAAFAVGHGAQGRAGIAVTGLLGFVLAAGFVLTGSLLVVVVAHYLVNAAEFVVYEGLGVELAWR